MRLKPILPVLREKKRYLGFQVISEDKLTLKEVEEAIKSSLNQFIGDLGLAKAGIEFLKDWKGQKGIIRVNTKELPQLKASLALIKDINKKKIIIKSFAVSGTLNNLRNKL